MSKTERFTNTTGAPVADNTNIMTAGPRGPALLQDVWLIEKLAHFDREVIPERRMHAKGSGAHGTFTVTHDITRYTKAKIFSEIGKQTPMFARFSTVAGERGAADALVGKDRESQQRDLFGSIERGEFPRWTLCIQVMTDEQATNFAFNPFDLTKVWPKADYPLIEVGYFELNRNPENVFAEVE